MTANQDQHLTNIKRTYRLYPDQDIQLFYGSSTVRSKIPQSLPRANDYLNTLEHYINGAIIQYHRIQKSQGRSLDLLSRLSQLTLEYLTDESLERELFDTQDEWADTAFTVVFLDIHFCIICLEKVENLHTGFFRSIAPLFQSATIHQIGTRRLIERAFRAALSEINDARNFLEHIDKEIGQGHPPSLSFSHTEASLTVTFGTPPQSAHLNVPLIAAAYERLIRLLQSLPDVN